MSVFLLTVGLVLVALPGVLARLGARLAPAEWCRAVVACLRMGSVAIRLGLALAAVPLVLQAVGADEVAHACHRSMTAGLPAPQAIGWVAGGALVASMLRSARAGHDHASALDRVRVEAWLGRHRVEDGVDVVTLPCRDRLAYAVPGRPGQVVVSDGLLDALDADEAAAVLRHERSHLRHRHQNALALAQRLESWLGWFPPTRRSTATLHLTIERWADEDAGSTSAAARPAVRRALVKVITLAVAPAPGFTDASTIAARLDALATTPPAPRWRDRLAATGPMVSASGLVVVAVGACAVVAHHGVDGLLGHCPF